jgi:hypothetical protein
MSFDLPRNRIVPVREVDVRLEDGPHPFAAGRETEIRGNWEQEVSRNPALFDGDMALPSCSGVAFDLSPARSIASLTQYRSVPTTR